MSPVFSSTRNVRAIARLTITAVILILPASCKQTPADPWGPIAACDIAVDFQSSYHVADTSGVRIVFQEFIQHSRADSLPIFGGTNNWRFDSAAPHGTYRSVKYWKVNASWFDEQNRQWITSTVFDVSQDGAVARLLGCP